MSTRQKQKKKTVIKNTSSTIFSWCIILIFAQDEELEGEVDGPVDFTIKSEHSTPPPAADLTDMAAFLANAAAAVRSAQVELDR